MRYLLSILFVSSMFCACQNKSTEQAIKDKPQAISSTVSLEEIDTNVFINFDLLPQIYVDDFPISNKMLKEQEQSSTTDNRYVSPDAIWFYNESTEDVLVFTLYTDYHRFRTLLFSKSESSCIIFEELLLYKNHIPVNDLCETQEQIANFLAKASNVSLDYFQSNEGVILNMNKEAFLEIHHHQVDSTYMIEEVEVLIWDFMGDITPELYEGHYPPTIAIDSYGHSGKAYFKENKLVAYFLFNNIP